MGPSDDEAMHSAGEDDVPARSPKKRRLETSPGQDADPEGPACQSCRKKKAKRSRQQPCSSCVKYNVECLYDDRKTKPGLRTGAVENLSQRVATLESMFLGQGILWQQLFAQLGSLANHDGLSNPQSHNSNPRLSLQDYTAQLKATLTRLANGQSYDSAGPCAFDTIGSGRGPSSWSIVGSMTRTVEQLQLSVEDEDLPPPSRVLIKRMAFLPPCRNWSETEERRRVFWNTFLLDRFCSIATGWNLSLTSADVKRRLPCEGDLWEAGEPLETPTPYFGFADQVRGAGANSLPMARPENEAQDSLGGFAYCIEATVSLSLVTSFFLQQPVDVLNRQEVQLWLLKFKQLDLRLVQWKIFLPDQWREACALNRDNVLDPNLTLAHISHNTAVVLLHQGIAYPAPEWQASGIRLPSASSSETCLAAATEVVIIAEKFLQGSSHLTNPQFAFCLFICGRMLLAHAAYYGVPLPRAFGSMVSSLTEMSRRWNGPFEMFEEDNLASKFARRLMRARAQGHAMPDLRQAVYSDDPQPETATAVVAQHWPPEGRLEAQQQGAGPSQSTDHEGSYAPLDDDGIDQDASPDSLSLAFPPLPIAFYYNQTSSRGPKAAPSPMVGHTAPIQAYDNSSSSGTGASMAAQLATMQGFEDLNDFLDYPLLPTERISVYSCPSMGRGHQK
ncbi:hypothetical protein VTI74DRAFT_7617 [Chaetomium olivicolor]